MKRWWLGVLMALFACDGIGEPIVDEIEKQEGDIRWMCQLPPPSCDEGFTSQAPFAAPMLVNPACSQLSEEACTSAAQGGNCRLTLQVVEDVPVQLPAQRCATIELSPALASENAELRPLNASSTRLRLRAEQPTTFVLADVDLQDVAIDLRGPITLRIEGRLRNVSLESQDAVSVTFSESIVEGLGLRLPNGSVRVQRSTLGGSQLAAREVELETVPVRDVQIASARMVGIELDGMRLSLDVGDLSLSEVEVRSLALHRCDTALLVNARLNEPRLAACSDRLRTNSSAIVEGIVHGTVESIRTYWGRSLLGSGRKPLTMEVWLGTLNSNLLCPGLERLTISQETSVGCNDCMYLPAPEQHICMPPLVGNVMPEMQESDAGTLPAGNTFCPILDGMLPTCDPAPRATSPL